MDAEKALKAVLKGTIACCIVAGFAMGIYYVYNSTESATTTEVSGIRMSRSYITGKGTASAPKAEASASSSSSSSSSAADGVLQTAQLSATVLPENTSNKSIVWKSSDETKITLSAKETESGEPVTVQMVAPFTGIVYVYAYPESNESLSASCSVTNYNETTALPCYRSFATVSGYASGSDVLVTKTGSDDLVVTDSMGSYRTPGGATTCSVGDGVGDSVTIMHNDRTMKVKTVGTTVNAGGSGANQHTVVADLVFHTSALYSAAAPTFMSKWTNVGNLYAKEAEVTALSDDDSHTIDPTDYANPGKIGGKILELQTDGTAGSAFYPAIVAQPFYSAANFDGTGKPGAGLHIKFTFTSAAQTQHLTGFTVKFGDVSSVWTFKEETAATSQSLNAGSLEF